MVSFGLRSGEWHGHSNYIHLNMIVKKFNVTEKVIVSKHALFTVMH